MEGWINKAELIIEKSHYLLAEGSCSNLFQQPLFKKLAEIYAEEAAKQIKLKSVSQTHRLLEKLVKRDRLNCLVVKLFKGNEGYSLAIRTGLGIETETVRLQYEDEEFLSYIDNEHLPPMLLDLLDEADTDIFYSGCIITEIRDFRRCLDSLYDSKYILLRPTAQSIVADVASLTKDGDWTTEEKLLLEAEIVKKTAPPLNLSPSPLIGVINNKMHLHKLKFSGVPLKRAAKRFSQVSQNRQKKFEEGPPPKYLKLHGFLSNFSKLNNSKYQLTKSMPKPTIPIAVEDTIDSGVDTMDQMTIDTLYKRAAEDVKKSSTVLERLQDTKNNSFDNSLVIVEEYVLETERGQGRIYLTKLTISQRRNDEIYFGELYVDRDYQEGKSNGSTCKFQLGTLLQVRRYIQQFKLILTEEGRKPAKISHKVAGQPVRTYYSHGSQDKKDTEKQQLHLQQPEQQIQTQQQQQLQHLPQGIIASFNLAGQQPVSLSMNTAGVTGGVSIAQPSTQNVIIVSNTDGVVKKSVNVVTKPVTVTSSSSLTNLIATQPIHQAAGSQQMVVGRSVNLNNLLTGRSIVGSGGSVTAIPGNTVTVTGTVPQAAKLAVVTAGQGATKLSLPGLPTPMNRPAPAYSQAISNMKSQDVCVQAQAKTVSNGIQTVTSSGTSNLQALLAGTSDNQNQTRSTALFERLTAVQPSVGVSKSEEGTPLKITTGSTSGGAPPSNALQQSSSNTAAGTSVAAPSSNINLANLANIPGINVGLQSLASNLQGVQNVQVSIPHFSVPICLSLNVPTCNATTSTVASSSPATVVTKTTGTSVVSTTATVMIASQSGLQQGQVVQLPLSHLSGSQLAAQLTKSAAQGGGPVTSSIPVFQVQNVGGSLFTPLRSSGNVSMPSVVSSSQSTALLTQPAGDGSQTLSTSSSEITLGSLSQSSGAAAGGPSIVTLTSKQPVQLAMAKQSGALTWQLQQKLIAAKRQQQQIHK